MKRREWKFQKSVAELEAAAKERVTYHLERLAVWEQNRADAEAAVHMAGITIRSYEQTGGSRHEAVVDQPLLARLGECEAKIAGHRASADEYAQWASALGSASGTLELDHDDWLFFFGLRGDEDD